MPSTEAMASDATTHVEPQSSANWMIALVSSSMKPAPRKKNFHDHPPPCPRCTQSTAPTDTIRMRASA